MTEKVFLATDRSFCTANTWRKYKRNECTVLSWWQVVLALAQIWVHVFSLLKYH